MDDKFLPTLVTIAIVLLIFLGMALSWRARRRRSAALAPEPVAVETLGAETAEVDAQYVATTVVEKPLERVLLPGLGFRGHAVLRMFEHGLVIEPRGEQPTSIPAANLRGAGVATYTIDRVVERDGLIAVTWAPQGDALVDSYFRIQDAGQRAATLATIQGLVPASSATEQKGN
ncbi:hypothetical protein HQQ81_14470 [Microbacteriaceae bacterium VKM Ac-2854]|nr:hypothetical protein [Microbacteriaceae bacterium VKM Ac-2854]